MSLVTLYGCKMGLLHMSGNVFNQCCENNLMIELSPITFQFCVYHDGTPELTLLYFLF